MDKRSELLESIATTITDYRDGEIKRPTPEHVDRWIRQFDKGVQLDILVELDYVLKNSYLSRAYVEEFLGLLAANPIMFGEDSCSFWKKVVFLNIQGGGRSQRDMLKMFNEILLEECNLGIKDCANHPEGVYLYLDDGIFTGSRVINDLSNWIQNHAPQKAKVHVVIMAAHKGGQWHANTKINEAIKGAKKEIQINWCYCMEVEDRKSYTNATDVLRPVRLPDEKLVQNYVESMRHTQILRIPGKVGFNRFFSSEKGRHLLEQEFLKAGVRIRSMCPYLNVYQRPLGNMVLETLGFGSMIVTHRNCPNNSPLALWAGNPWYPLFPRKVN